MEEEKHEEGDMKEVEVLEFSLTGEEVDELIGKLTQLKQLKTSISFDVDDENEFVIHYEAGGDVVEDERKPTDSENLADKGYEKSTEIKPNQENASSEPDSKPGEIPSLDDVERQ